MTTFSHAYTCVWLKVHVQDETCAHSQKHSIRKLFFFLFDTSTRGTFSSDADWNQLHSHLQGGRERAVLKSASGSLVGRLEDEVFCAQLCTVRCLARCTSREALCRHDTPVLQTMVLKPHWRLALVVRSSCPETSPAPTTMQSRGAHVRATARDPLRVISSGLWCLQPHDRTRGRSGIEFHLNILY